MSDRYTLTKTTFVQGSQCAKLLYLGLKHPELKAPDRPEDKRRMEEGILVGKLAHQLYPQGILISERGGPAVERTRQVLDKALTLFEATFLFDGVLARIDILHRESLKSDWQLIEVKSSTKLKAEHIPDIAVQLYVAEKSGIKVANTHLLCLNNQARGQTPQELFHSEDATEKVREYLPQVPVMVAEMKMTLGQGEIPKIKIGPHCDKPHECGFKSFCWKDVPSLSVLDLYKEPTAKKFALFHSGTIELTDPTAAATHPIGQRMMEVARTGKRFVDASGIKRAISSWKLPFYHLDFETLGSGLPRFANSHPYEAIPIQFSCLIQDKPGAEPIETVYLHADSSDPRETLAKALCTAIGDEGTVLAFYSSFEEAVVRRLATLFPQYSAKLNSILDRLADPQEVFREHVYDHGFKGTFSLKTVAPAILGEKFAYSDLAIQSGDRVAVLFDEFNHPETSDERRTQIRKDLLEYCRQDTMAMAKLVDWLFAQAK